MTNDRPKGRELAAIRAIIKLVDPICCAQSSLAGHADQMLNDRIADEHNVTWRITERFARDGVRSNGTDHLTTLATVIVGLRRIRKRHAGLQRGIDGDLRRLTKLLEKAERIVAPFRLCPACKGGCGRKGEVRPIPGRVAAITRWHDCEACGGRGIAMAKVRP